MAKIQISTLIQVSLLLMAVRDCSAQGNIPMNRLILKLNKLFIHDFYSAGASASGLSSGTLGGIVAGVFIGVTICVCIVLFGFCCWNNYQDSRMTSYNNYNQSGDNQTTGEQSTRLCGCVRGASVACCSQSGCCQRHEEPEQQSHTTIPTIHVSDSSTDANLVAPSVNAVSDSNDFTDSGINAAPPLAEDVITSADLSINKSTPNPSSDTHVVQFNIGVANDDCEANASEEPTITKIKYEVNTSAADPSSETLVDVININQTDVAPPSPDVYVTNCDVDTDFTTESPDD